LDFQLAISSQQRVLSNVVSTLNGLAASEYRELQLELYELQRALHGTEHLEPLPGQEAEVNAVKVAALMCWYPLLEFQSKLKRYRRLSQGSQLKTLDVVKGWGRKVQRNFCMSDEVQKLRAYIAAHTGSLNMRLTTLGLATIRVANEKAEQTDGPIQSRLEDQTALVSENTRRADSLYKLLAVQVLPQLQNLVELATKVWLSNLQTMDYFSSLKVPLWRLTQNIPDSKTR
jgi:hypothetical protein